jgi:hypothetical protein
MKYLKNYERRNFKDYKKYNIILKKNFIADKASVFEEYGELIISLQYSYIIRNEILVNLFNIFKGLDFRIYNGTSNSIIFEVSDVPAQYFERIDIEKDSNKYNI